MKVRQFKLTFLKILYIYVLIFLLKWIAILILVFLCANQYILFSMVCSLLGWIIKYDLTFNAPIHLTETNESKNHLYRTAKILYLTTSKLKEITNEKFYQRHGSHLQRFFKWFKNEHWLLWMALRLNYRKVLPEWMICLQKNLKAKMFYLFVSTIYYWGWNCSNV